MPEQGCGWDLLVHGKNLDASGGDVALALAAGEELYIADAVAGTGTLTKPKEDGHIAGYGGVSEDGALTNFRIGLSGEEDRIGGSLFHSGQGEAAPLNMSLARAKFPIKSGNRIKVEITNGAAKCDSVGMLIGRGSVIPKLSSEPFGELPEDSAWVEATTAHTATVDTWTDGAITFPDTTFDLSHYYYVLGAAWTGATLQWYRLLPKSGPDKQFEPGWRGGTTNLLNEPVYWNRPIMFNPNDGINLDTFCTAGDTSAAGMMCIVKGPKI